MAEFIIVELEDGFSVVEVQPGERPDDAAARHRGTLVDPGPFATFQEADDALINRQIEEQEQD
jgi:hypothetical protein